MSSPEPVAAEQAPDALTPQERKSTLLAHLQALRRVLIVSAGAVVVALFLVFGLLVNPLIEWIKAPLIERGIDVATFAITEALVTKFKISLIAAVILASPVIIWQVWSFIKPALYPKERRYFRILFFAALFLFLAGVAFCYFAVYKLALDFLLTQAKDIGDLKQSFEKYISYMVTFILPFGVAFQLPVFLHLTTRIGLTNAKMLASKRKYVILGIFVLAAVLTPPDIVSQIALGVPMCLLYEVSILVAKMTKARQRE